MKDLIMGYATNSKFDDFYRFVTSARQHCSPDKVDIVIFSNALGNQFAQVALDKNITLVPVENVWKWVTSSKILNLFYHTQMLGLRILMRLSLAADRPWIAQAYRNTVGDWIHPQAGRWKTYQTFLTVNSSYRMIMTSDVRDVVFQSSPFDHLDSNALQVFEQEGISYGHKGQDQDRENIDTRWFTAIYGKKALKSMLGKVTLCSGTVLGGNLVMMKFLELMVSEMQHHSRKPLDQAMFNNVIANQLKSVQIVRHNLRSGSVLTLTGNHQDFWKIQEDRVMVDDRIVPVIHMYDRNPHVKDLFLRKIPILSK